MAIKQRTANHTASKAPAPLSPAHRQIIEALQSDEACSVAEISARLDRSPRTVLAHVRQLVAAGLLEEVGPLRSGGHAEICYRMTSTRVAATPKPRSTTSSRLAEEVIGITLRRAASEARRALRTGLVAELPVGGFIGRRITAWLDDARLRKITAHLEAVESLMSEGRDRRIGRRMAFTVVLVPVGNPRDDT